MQQLQSPWPDPASFLAHQTPDAPVLFLSPQELKITARGFRQAFAGLVTYAVKANPGPEVLANLNAAGITCFDVASPAEMAAVRAINPMAVLHYNNPVRSQAEIVAGISARVASWSVDEMSELDKLAQVPRGTEIAVRFALPVPGAAYDFGEKFGADPDGAADLLRRVVARGYEPALCFHPGTQCADPEAWARYIRAAARIAARAQVKIARLNVGGGFAAHREYHKPDLAPVFDTIARETRAAFGADAPVLVCEPGRAMVSDAFTLATRVKSLRKQGEVVYLNDGIYGGLTDQRDMGLTARVRVLRPDGKPRHGRCRPRIVFGPTCDSLDRLPDGLMLPEDMQPDDYLLWDGMGAYSIAMTTGFNGYGVNDVVTVLSLSGHCRDEG